MSIISNASLGHASFNLTLDPSPVTLAEWRRLFALIPRSTLLQSYDYARAICAHEHLRPTWRVIRINGQIAGLLQILEASLFGRAIHSVMIDRGPLWLPGFGTADHWRAFLQALGHDYPRRFGRKRRFLPEVSHGLLPNDAFQNTGFQPVQGIKPYQTIWVDLMPLEDMLRENLRSNWRNHLALAEKNDLAVLWDDRGISLPPFLSLYEKDRRHRLYRGPSSNLLRTMAKTFSMGDGFLIGTVMKNDAPLAAALFFRHGCCATWQAGWVMPEGRPVQANTLLLWQSLLKLKEMGVSALDLGGINDEDAVGVRDFKMGLGGEKLTLIGQYD